MRVRQAFAYFFAALFVITFSRQVFSGESRIESATRASNEWLAVVDIHHYAESWDTLASLFKKKVARSGWKKEMASIRVPLGKLESRKLLGAKYVRNLPDAPEGEYVVIQYQSSFENNAHVLETVVPMLEEDGLWRVAGYFVKGMPQ